MSIQPSIIVDRQPVFWLRAVGAVARSAGHTAIMLAGSRVRMPRDRVGQVLRFADGTTGRIYRETVYVGTRLDDPAVLVVGFRLHAIRGVGHAAFRVESLLNTPLFAGFPGFVSKLWLANDETGLYRGVYQWNGADRADAYARRLWWVLALVCPPHSIKYAVLAARRRDEVLADPRQLDAIDHDSTAWWRVTG